MADSGLDPYAPPSFLHLVSAFLAMEPSDALISLARTCGGGLITEQVQRFIWGFCITATSDKGNANAAYLKNFVKKLILEIESSRDDGIAVLDELYVQYAYYMSSLKDDISGRENARVYKCISFLFPDGCLGSPSCPESKKLVVQLYSSLNMLEGDTGCSIWPSSLYLSEFILSFPHIFSNKKCFEVGSGVGLVGVCLSHVKASKVILSDGDLSTLANMKLNLELNKLRVETDMPEKTMHSRNSVKCIHLPWESATRNELQEFIPHVVLGADIIYDPSSLPHLVRVLAILLDKGRVHSHISEDNGQRGQCVDVKVDGANKGGVPCHSNGSDCNVEGPGSAYANGAQKKGHSLAFFATVIRSIETFNCFMQVAAQANLSVTDVTETHRPLDFLPYMHSYSRSCIRLFCVTIK